MKRFCVAECRYLQYRSQFKILGGQTCWI